jgi:uncharacterized membrane protein (UPF0127 family)
VIFNKKTFLARVGVSFALLCFQFSCFSSKPFKTTRLSIATAAGKTVPISVEIAETEEERRQGFMFREKLEDGKGMIFLFEKDQIMSFWMKNTLVPLSIAFILSDGRIAEIRDMEPRSLASVNSERSCRYALEAPQGWFSRAGIGVGDRLSVEGLSIENPAQ